MHLVPRVNHKLVAKARLFFGLLLMDSVVCRGEEGAGDQLGPVARLRRPAGAASAGRQPRRLLPTGPQRAGKCLFFFRLAICFLQIILCSDACLLAIWMDSFCLGLPFD